MIHTRDTILASLYLVVGVEERTWVLHTTSTSTIGILLSFRLIGKIGWASIGTLATASVDSIIHFRTQILAARNWGEYQNPTLTLSSAGEQN